MNEKIKQLLLSEDENNIRLGLTLFFTQDVGELKVLGQWHKQWWEKIGKMVVTDFPLEESDDNLKERERKFLECAKHKRRLYFLQDIFRKISSNFSLDEIAYCKQYNRKKRFILYHLKKELGLDFIKELGL